MSLEAIQKITKIEKESQEKKTAAEVEARQLQVNAQQEGQALLEQVRALAAEDSRKRIREAEENAAKKAEEITRETDAQSAALRETANEHMRDAVALIVGRIVKH